MPVLGILGPARQALLGNEVYDGVVPIIRSDFGGDPASGSILSTPMYILTAAHVIGKADVNGALELPATAIDFPIERQDGGGPTSIHVDIPGGANFLSVPRNPTGLFWNPNQLVKDADIGIISLPDQEELPNPTPGRVMIAPFRKTAWGGNRYDIYTTPLPFDGALPAADRKPLKFNMVGYGETGLTGAVGNSSDRVDRITIPARKVGEANTFTLKVGAGAEETAPIRQDATPAAIAAALYALPINGSDAHGRLNHVVNDLIDGKVTAGVWDIRSVNGRGSSSHGGGVTSITRSDAGAAPTVTNQWAGGHSGGTKRYGENDFDRTQPAGLGFERNDRIIQGDFDDWSNRISVFGTDGIDANNETGTGRGDSGGPGLFQTGNDAPKIVGVLSYGFTDLSYPDTSKYVYLDSNSVVRGMRDSSIGEVFGYTHVMPYMDTFVSPYINRKVDLLLDMNYQTYGKSVSGENIEIVVRNVGGRLQVEVHGGEASLDGIYADVDAANVKSLTIRGSNDNETVRIVGDLGIGSNVYVDGREGMNALEADFRSVIGDGHHYTVGASAGGWETRLSRAANAGAAMVARPWLDSKNIAQYTLDTGSGEDVIRVEKGMTAPAGGDGDTPCVISVNANGGRDEICVGSEVNGFDSLAGAIYINGKADNGLPGDTAKLTYLDAEGAERRDIILGRSALQFQGWDLQLVTLGTPWVVHSKFVDQYIVNAGRYNDAVKVDATAPTATNGTYIFGTAVDDVVKVGSALVGMADIMTTVHVDGGTGADTIDFNDSQNAGEMSEYTIGKSNVAGWDTRLSRAGNPGPVAKPWIDSKNTESYFLRSGSGSDYIRICHRHVRDRGNPCFQQRRS